MGEKINMDFKTDGPEDWNSSLAEDVFIQAYFNKNSVSVASKKRKRKKRDVVGKKEIEQESVDDELAKEKCDMEKEKWREDYSHPRGTSQNKKKASKLEPKILVKSSTSSKKKLVPVPKNNSVSSHEKQLIRDYSNGTDAFKGSNSLPLASPTKIENMQKPKKVKTTPLGPKMSVESCDVVPGTNNKSFSKHKKRLSRDVSNGTISVKESNILPLASPTKIKDVQKKSGIVQNKPHLNTSDCPDRDETLREELKNNPIFKKLLKFTKETPQLHFNDTSDNEFASDCRYSDVDEESGNSEQEVEFETLNSSPINFPKSSLKTPQSTIKNSSQCFKKLNDTSCKMAKIETCMVDNENPVSERSKKMMDLNRTCRERLQAAKFRYLNEQLYTQTGTDAFKYFHDNTDEFMDYHTGYNFQVSKWPMNPVNEIISDLQKLKKSTVVADMGCGDAKIAQVFKDRQVHSFDLVALNHLVTPCNISKVPLPNQSVDVVVFCLSLMGTNLTDYLCEANRILKMGGTLKIAEVESRIQDLENFIQSLNSLGFTLEKKNLKHKLFIFLDLKKEARKIEKNKLPSITMLPLKPCFYKKR